MKSLAIIGDLAGKLTLEWDVLDTGKVDRVKVLKELYPSLDQCVSRVIKASPFPKAPSGQIARVKYPFKFAPTKASTK